MTYRKFHPRKPIKRSIIEEITVSDGALQYDIEQKEGFKKLIGTTEDYRGYAYFTTCIESAKRAIKMDWMIRNGII